MAKFSNSSTFDEYIDLSKEDFYPTESVSHDDADTYENTYLLQSLSHRFEKLSDQMVSFTQVQEDLLHRMTAQKDERDHAFGNYCKGLNKQIHEIHFLMNEFKSVMTQAGVARWRIAAEEALGQGKDHLMLLTEHTEVAHSQIQAACDRLESLTQQAESRISKVVRSFRLEYFRQLMENTVSPTVTEPVSLSSMQRVTSGMRWLQWEKFTVAVIVALLVAIVMSLFVNDEWPWESHEKVLNEREAGKMLIEAWPVLSSVQRHEIESAIAEHHKQVSHLTTG